ncbi:hypothetical protein HY994_01755 [Candidatus Micrarchaeota archaeon]|nr:hypothetical protein [Candidatus Micrarchaeota archaeon]
MPPEPVGPKWIEEPHLITKQVEPHHIVLHVGPYAFGKDPVPFFLGTHLKESEGGMLILLDAQGNDNGAKNWPRRLPAEFLLPRYSEEKSNKDSRFASSAGRPKVYAETMAGLNRNGRYGPLLLPYLHFENAMDTSIRDGKVDCIIDRGSAAHILSGNVDIKKLEKEGRLETKMQNAIHRLASEYHRLLKPGGRLIMLFDDAQKYPEKFHEAFRKIGFEKIDAYRLTPDAPYRVPQFVNGTKTEEVDLNVNSHNYTHALVAFKRD